MREGLTALLDQEDDMIVVGEAANGVEALAKLENFQPDIVLIDLSMPLMNGVETTRRIKERMPSLPVLILSMYGDAVGVTRALRAGALGYIVKESVVEELTFAIREVADGRHYLSPLVDGPIVQDYLQGIPSQDDGFDKLTPRESEVLQLLAEGHSIAKIASMLTISQSAVRRHQANLKSELGLKNRADILRYALDHHMVVSHMRPSISKEEE